MSCSLPSYVNFTPVHLSPFPIATVWSRHLLLFSGHTSFPYLVFTLPVSHWLQFIFYIAANVVFLEQKANPVSIVYFPPEASALSLLPAPPLFPMQPATQPLLTSPGSWRDACPFMHLCPLHPLWPLSRLSVHLPDKLNFPLL